MGGHANAMLHSQATHIVPQCPYRKHNRNALAKFTLIVINVLINLSMGLRTSNAHTNTNNKQKKKKEEEKQNPHRAFSADCEFIMGLSTWETGTPCVHRTMFNLIRYVHTAFFMSIVHIAMALEVLESFYLIFWKTKSNPYLFGSFCW